ncbi:MAG: hypothetical protein WC608_02195 [Parcubacteria group bacterium]
MKIYSIIITIIAIIAVIFAGVFYSQVSTVSQQADAYKKSGELCQADKSKTESQLSQANGKLANLQKTADVLDAAANSFMFAGDMKVSTVGSREAAEVEQKISSMTDKSDRMETEKNWNDFKTTLKLNPLFGLLRGLAQSLNRNFSQQSGNQPPLQQPIK